MSKRQARIAGRPAAAPVLVLLSVSDILQQVVTEYSLLGVLECHVVWCEI